MPDDLGADRHDSVRAGRDGHLTAARPLRIRSSAGDNVPIAETLAAFDARLHDRHVPDDIISGLIPGQGITLLHGQPRALKSWAALDIGLSAALGVPAFGLDRFRPARTMRTWHIVAEDGATEVRRRARCVLAGRSLSMFDLPFFVSAEKGIDLDDPDWQDRLIAIATAEQIDLTIIDPLRSATLCVDQGPREMQPLARFCRRFIRETSSVLLLVHHDVKPTAGKPDDRARPQRASGGGIFSIADAPIHTELIGPGSRAVITPSHYKFSVAPDPFTIRLDTDDPQRPTWARIVGEKSTVPLVTAGDVGIPEKLLAFLADHPKTSGSAIAKALHVGKAQALTTLSALHAKGLVTFLQRGQARLWIVTVTEGRV